MKKIFIYMVISLLVGALTACTGKQSDKGTERYHINFSETSPVQKANKSVLIISGSPRKGGNTDLLGRWTCGENLPCRPSHRLLL